MLSLFCIKLFENLGTFNYNPSLGTQTMGNSNALEKIYILNTDLFFLYVISFFKENLATFYYPSLGTQTVGIISPNNKIYLS